MARKLGSNKEAIVLSLIKFGVVITDEEKEATYRHTR